MCLSTMYYFLAFAKIKKISISCKSFKNTKNNIKYSIIEEEDIGYNDEVLKNIADDVFKNVKIEME